MNSSIVVACFALCAFAPGDLRTHEFDYYIVQTNLSLERTALIGRVMDATGLAYHRHFQGFRGVVRRKPRVKVFATKEQYLADCARSCGEAIAHSAGIYCTRDETVYTFDSERLETTLKHECFHQFAAQVIGGRLARWTNEGLAEYFEEGAFDEKTGRLTLGATPKRRIDLLAEAREKRKLIPIDQLMQISGREWGQNIGSDRGRLQYAQAWLLCHFLIHGDGGRYLPLFERFLRHIDEGLDSDTAFKNVFGADLRPLQTKLQEYILQLQPAAANDGDSPPPGGE